VALQSRVYIATKVTSEFRSGRFEQTLEGKLYTFLKSDASNAAEPSVAALATNKTGSDAGRIKPTQATVRGIDNAIAARARAEAETAAAAQARSNFAKTDPRRLDTGDGGKRAILGAQGAYKEAKFTENAGGAAFGNPNITRQGITAGATLLPANPPANPTDSTGTSLQPTQSQTTRAAPQKLPGAGPGTNGLTIEQRREVNRRAIEQTNRELAEEYEGALGGAPTTAQKIVKDRG